MLGIEIRFSQDDLNRAVTRALSRWSNKSVEYARVNGSEGSDRVSGYAGIKIRSDKTPQISLSHDLIVQAVVISSALDGTPIDPASLKFHYSPSRGHGGGSSTSATANTTNVKPDLTNDSKLFPVTVSVTFDEKECLEILKAAVAQQGGDPTCVTLSGSGAEPTASITVKLPGGKTGSVNWKGAQLCAEFATELRRRGYTVADDAIEFKYTPGAGYGGGPHTDAYVKLTGFPG